MLKTKQMYYWRILFAFVLFQFSIYKTHSQSKDQYGISSFYLNSPGTNSHFLGISTQTHFQDIYNDNKYFDLALDFVLPIAFENQRELSKMDRFEFQNSPNMYQTNRLASAFHLWIGGKGHYDSFFWGGGFGPSMLILRSKTQAYPLGYNDDSYPVEKKVFFDVSTKLYLGFDILKSPKQNLSLSIDLRFHFIRFLYRFDSKMAGEQRDPLHKIYTPLQFGLHLGYTFIHDKNRKYSM